MTPLCGYLNLSLPNYFFNLNRRISFLDFSQPDLSGALFARRDPSTSSGQASKKAGTEGGLSCPNKIILINNYLGKAFAIPPSTLMMFPVVLSKIATHAKTPLAMSSGRIISFNRFLFA